MTRHQIIEVLCLYDETIEHRAKVEAKKGSGLAHVRWMCQEVQRLAADEMITPPDSRVEKIHRWLGFIQGSLWSDNIFTIDEMREHNRNGKEKDKESEEGVA